MDGIVRGLVDGAVPPVAWDVPGKQVAPAIESGAVERRGQKVVRRGVVQPAGGVLAGCGNHGVVLRLVELARGLRREAASLGNDARVRRLQGTQGAAYMLNPVLRQPLAARPDGAYRHEARDLRWTLQADVCVSLSEVMEGAVCWVLPCP